MKKLFKYILVGWVLLNLIGCQWEDMPEPTVGCCTGGDDDDDPILPGDSIDGEVEEYYFDFLEKESK